MLAVLAFFWLTQNIRPIPPGSQAIVSRFGAVVRVQQDGVLVAWPPPVEHVVVLPVGERQLLQKGPDGAAQIADTVTVLTGDGNLVTLDATLAWSVKDRSEGVGWGARFAPVMSAIFEASAVAVAARHNAADILAPAGGAGAEIAALVASRMDDLQSGSVEITRAAVTAALPASVREAAEGAEATARAAEAALVAARAAAAQRLQQTDRDRDRIFANAHAEAAERLAFARSSTATLTALEARLNPATRPALLADLYRERIAGILRQAGSVSTVDPKSVSKVVIPDGGP